MQASPFHMDGPMIAGGMGYTLAELGELTAPHAGSTGHAVIGLS